MKKLVLVALGLGVCAPDVQAGDFGGGFAGGLTGGIVGSALTRPHREVREVRGGDSCCHELRSCERELDKISRKFDRALDEIERLKEENRDLRSERGETKKSKKGVKERFLEKELED